MSRTRAPLAAALLLAATAARAQDSPFALLDRLEAAWQSKDAAGWLAAWTFDTTEQREAEARYLNERFAAEESRITLRRPGPIPVGTSILLVSLDVVTINEPRGQVEQWNLTLGKDAGRWSVTGKELTGDIDGLIHLSLDPGGRRADGVRLTLPDFELAIRHGTLFFSPANVGPTVLVFVGEATLSFRPRPTTEQEQLRQFCGRPQLVETVKRVFARIHPADLHHVLSPAALPPDPQAAGRFRRAQQFYAQHVSRTFLLDSVLPRSPWWLLPSVGDASVTFDAGRRGVLTYALNRGEPEGISLFDRARRRQICLYPVEGDSTDYSEDAGRAAEVRHHSLLVRIEPALQRLEAADRMRLELLAAAATLRLRLDDSLVVRSISSRAGEHLFFRVRGQDSIMVSLGPLAGSIGELELTVRYGGRMTPETIERELIQASEQPVYETEIPLEPVLVYTNRSPWYPQTGPDDYATYDARFDVPAAYTAVTGGQRLSARTENDRTLLEFAQDRPAKYIAVAVGRLQEAGTRRAGGLALQALAVSRMKSEAERMLQRAGEMLAFFAEEFGPCPYPSLSLVVMEGAVPGGHSPPGIMLLSERPVMLGGRLRDDPTNFTDVPGFFLAHELAHQWWGHGVAGQNYHERWLSEAFAQYAAALWVRRARGEAVFQDVLRRMAKWAIRHAGWGPISLGYRLGHVKGEPQVFRALVYDKGAYVLHMLRGILGEDAFRAAVRAFQLENRFGKAGTEMLRRAFEQAAGRPLDGYFEAWVFGTAIPGLRYLERPDPAAKDSRLIVEVRPENLPGPVPLEIAVSLDRGSERRSVTLPPQGAIFRFDLPGPPRKVQLNSDQGLLANVSRLGGS